MTTGVEEDGTRRSVARADLTRRAAFPALVLALALFCVEGLQLLSSVVRQDLTSPPLVDVPPIDLGSSPAPARPTVVAGAVFDGLGFTADVELAPVTVETTVAEVAAPALSVDPEVATPVGVQVGDLLVPEAALVAAPAPVAAVTEPVVDAGDEGEATSAKRKKKDRDTPGGSSSEPGPPPGRPVGPECDAVPGRRAACDRRPPTG